MIKWKLNNELSEGGSKWVESSTVEQGTAEARAVSGRRRTPPGTRCLPRLDHQILQQLPSTITVAIELSRFRFRRWAASPYSLAIDWFRVWPLPFAMLWITLSLQQQPWVARPSGPGLWTFTRSCRLCAPSRTSTSRIPFAPLMLRNVTIWYASKQANNLVSPFVRFMLNHAIFFCRPLLHLRRRKPELLARRFPLRSISLSTAMKETTLALSFNLLRTSVDDQASLTFPPLLSSIRVSVSVHWIWTPFLNQIIVEIMLLHDF